MPDRESTHHYRKAVTETLGALLAQPDMATALQMIGAFDPSSASGTIAYIGALARRFGFADEVRRRLCLELYTALQRPAAPVESDPSPPPPRAQPEPAASRRDDAVPKRILSPELQIFLALALAINREVMAKGPNAHQDFSEAFGELKGQSPFRDLALLSQWPKQAADIDAASTLAERELSALFHLVYMALCEALGPVKADKTLQAVIAEAEQHPSAREFSPRRLL